MLSQVTIHAGGGQGVVGIHQISISSHKRISSPDIGFEKERS